MQGYRNELRRQQQGRQATVMAEPRVREPEGGLRREEKINRETYVKRQSAGGGILSGSITSHERSWQLAESSLFSNLLI